MGEQEVGSDVANWPKVRLQSSKLPSKNDRINNTTEFFMVFKEMAKIILFSKQKN
jgi:hypothetical protein